MARKSATVIPLFYGFHTEHAIAIVDTDWNRLEELLFDPNRYFHNARNSWKLFGPARVVQKAWMVTEPATAILTPIHRNLHMVSHALLAAGVTGLNVENTIEDRALKGTATLLDQKEFKNGGFFVVQFAIDTSVIHIGYFPPKKFARRYHGGYTKPTICKFGTPGLACLSAHVDLEEPPSGTLFRGLRAKFLVDLISDYPGFLANINSDDGYLVESPMVSDTLTPTGDRPSITIPPEPDNSTRVSDKYVLKGALTYGSLALPTVTVDQMGETDLPGTPCVWPKGVTTTTSSEGVTTVESEDVVVKYYPEPTPTGPTG